ncbi:MAG: protein translocase subunit SecDF [Bacteroidetes bacterium]|nr:protein translocase subunit SecDF [Bacteroidota bacterium]MBS1671867.1 protein translocase subunit SecDF [Bacteroidota bacterium]
MQLKGLVRFFAIALILICVYTLSFTWIVRSYEGTINQKADKQVKNLFALTPEQKYPASAELRAAYADTLKQAKDSLVRHMLDSSNDVKIGPFGWTTYRSAKDKELQLGLDLQGGISVTMEVGLDGLIKSLANYPKDEKFNAALNNAITRKANSGADLISLFIEEYKKANPSGNLAPFFSAQSSGKIKFTSSEREVVNYLKTQADAAFKNTVRIIRTRVDKFGVSSPNINPDESKGIINIELAGANNPERVKSYLQSTANLQFFEVYTVETLELRSGLEAANKAVKDYLSGVKPVDSSSQKKDTAKTKTVVAKTDTTKSVNLSDVAKNTTTTNTADTSAKAKPTDNPLTGLLVAGPQPYQSNGKTIYPAAIAYIQTKDTGTFSTYIRMEAVKSKFPSNLVFMFGKMENSDDPSKTKNILALYAIKTLDNGQAELGGEGITAFPDYDERGRPAISMQMDSKGTAIWAKMTAKNVNHPIAVVLDNVVYSAPNVNGAITGGNSQISGNFTVQEAQDLSEILMTGKLPAPAKIVQSQEIGATLGEAAIKGGILSFIISFIIIFGLMLLYYNSAGWVANIALILNLLFTIGILTAMGFTLTAAGIAGLVLTIGMAVDTNVIIFERIKEELTKGKGYATAVNDGYKRSLAPVLDAHVTSLLTAIILAYFGLGPVLGFATTQIIGILLSLFCGILVSRLITDMYAGNKNRHFEYFTPISKKIFKHAAYKFIEYRKVTYSISAVIFVLGIASYFNGFDKGVEFEGGRSYTVKFDKPVKQEAVLDDLKKVFEGEAPIIKTVGNANQLNITTAYKIEETGKNIDSLVERTLFTGLKKYLPENLTYTEFDGKYKQSTQTVLPTISDDLKSGATKATIFAIIMICLYIFIRFRDWRYSLGTIFSLLHDVLVTLIVFSFARKIVPFPLEIDQHFIAAILTVIGFSMNDTIIVYDRIREDSRLYRGESNAQIINKAINQTLSRTIMTSLTVFLTILILFIFGGEVTRGFSFAMLIGVVTGTYSSIFVAAPILVDFAKNKPLGKQEKK